MGKMRRNHENTNAIVTANHHKLKAIQERQLAQDSNIATIMEFVTKQKFEMDMEAPDIGVFFPVTDAKQLELFMDRSHPDWDARRKEFYNMLFTCLSDNKGCFTKGLLHTLFTRKYMLTVKWPSTG